MKNKKRDRYLNIYFWLAIIIYISLILFLPNNKYLEFFGLFLVFLFFLLRLIFRRIDKRKDE
ncbi:hypothetical protein QP110_06525 [Aerococcus sp. UMB10185]|uniref:hypothetical protein n=1 Tax=unclassified Aerococcus TaxID=2618060 RepID=UPI0008A23CB9|nr:MULTISPECIES: hypothetical protein [unclassified Aerococcus]MDK6233920.1 hypothetical protein [Aerococcus sp. UMB10185]MDK6805741.1 hypothetical protein [Aerococcus sp. UMB7834]MDK6856363.1 hypothetical protein [Aerococcus sp. UMB7533]MDK8502666.1 hypothetical protein [Aerococcus sp. UMB1112A]OFN03826.1 hypothetical protein HMPREF2626_05245 [Aerococcus sp. HMSC062A02]